MRARVASGLSLGAALLLVTWYGRLPFLLVVMAGAVLALHEFYTLAARGTVRPLRVVASAGAVLFLAAVGLSWPDQWLGALVAGIFLVTLVALLPAGGTSRARRVLADWAVTVAGLAYLVPPMAALLALRAAPQGLTWVFLLFAATWLCDTGAFFAGRSFGHTPFFQAISPHKTREGALAGVASGALGALVVAWAGHLALSPLLALVAGGTIAAAAEAGDLVESLLKRQVGVKDAGTLIPGHGGLLDRIDSLLFATVVTFYWYLLTTA